MSGETPGWWDLILKEYEYHRANIDKFDNQRFQVRNWAIAVVGGILALAFQAESPLVATGSVVSTVFFGFLEALYMTMQAGVIDRSNHLEVLIEQNRLENAVQPDYDFGVGHAYRGSISLTRIARTVFVRGRVHITIFYAAMLVATITATVFVAYL